MSADVELATRLREARARASLTAVAAAKALGVTPQTLSAWERKGRGQAPSDENIKAAAALYEVTASWLRYGDDDFTDFPLVEDRELSASENGGSPIRDPRKEIRRKVLEGRIVLSPQRLGRASDALNYQDFFLHAIGGLAHSLQLYRPWFPPAREEFPDRAFRYLSSFAMLAESWSLRADAKYKVTLRRLADLDLLRSLIEQLIRAHSFELQETDELSRQEYLRFPQTLALDPNRFVAALGAEPTGSQFHFLPRAAVSTKRLHCVEWFDDHEQLMIEIDCTSDSQDDLTVVGVNTADVPPI